MTANEVRSLVVSRPGHPPIRLHSVLAKSLQGSRAIDMKVGPVEWTGQWEAIDIKAVPESTLTGVLFLSGLVANLCASFEVLNVRVLGLGAELRAARRDIRRISEEMRERPVVRQISVSDLGRPGLSLAAPLSIVIEEYPDQVLARWPEVEATGWGSSEPEAIWSLKQAVVQLMEELSSSTEDELGPEPRQALQVLSHFVRRNG